MVEALADGSGHGEAGAAIDRGFVGRGASCSRSFAGELTTMNLRVSSACVHAFTAVSRAIFCEVARFQVEPPMLV